MAGLYLMDEVQYDAAIEALRRTEYPSIQDSTYLDHAGTTLPSRSLMETFGRELTQTLYGNPHSASSPSQLSSCRIEDVRLALLSFLGADPRHFDLVFVANATAGIKLVTDGLRSMPHGYGFIHHEACHTSVIGAREEAAWTQCLSEAEVDSWTSTKGFTQSSAPRTSATLFAYSAQSHFDGRRYPLSWSDAMRKASVDTLYTLLDASSFCSSSSLDLSNSQLAPDFVVLSLYKILGFPDLGILLVRKPAENVFAHRKYFGGGTVDMVLCGKQQWHAPKTQALHERLEDGTLPFHNIIAAGIALEMHKTMFGTMGLISRHTSHLANHLRQGLAQLKHANGLPIAVQYGSDDGDDALGRGPIVTFNVRDSSRAWVSLSEFEKLANVRKIHVRTGGMCSPGGVASALGLEPWEMRRNFSAGFRCGAEDDIVAGKPTGAIRASFGAMSTLSDVTRFLDFLSEFFVEQNVALSTEEDVAVDDPVSKHALRVKAVTVFPIKSCGGYTIPPGVEWEVKPEGLAWDREWCLVHQGSGQALSQKRYPVMALLRPTIDFATGVLRISYCGTNSLTEATVSIPLEEDPRLFEASISDSTARVCGEPVSMMRYACGNINDFFSEVIGVPCVLARFPAGGRGMASRNSKAKLQTHQRKRAPRLPGAFPGVPSPPDSDSELYQPGRILLSNESPILMIYSSSVAELNRCIADTGADAVPESTFRANIVLESTESGTAPAAYAEDSWENIQIGSQRYRLLGACRRCQMVCVDQETGKKGQEPLSTLAKTRRYDGKVYFGAHMRHEPWTGAGGSRNSRPWIKVGDLVSIDSLAS
ncbi:hypothetical protein NLU13_1959 [Sarocladium strictum]|uniref:Molybdenum cofactor sulfurase n=1 Tax=Sarocladium strictum TaxID=5046 RepID=A0AA39LD02_SARSR|nr:hypothetical protein NLU13_1959 [Sarocladium strictum]